MTKKKDTKFTYFINIMAILKKKKIQKDTGEGAVLTGYITQVLLLVLSQYHDIY